MFSFGIRYLNGFVVAAEFQDHNKVEWPPHPARVFMALAATHFQTGSDLKEKEALLWLERLNVDGKPMAPTIVSSEYSQRTPTTHYVPVNDKSGPSKALLQTALLTRRRQPRTFAHAWLNNDIVYMTWSDADPSSSVRTALGNLCRKVARIGHSISFVQMWLASAKEIGEPTWEPKDENPDIRLRIATKGTLKYLEQRFNAEKVNDYCSLQIAAFDDSNPKKQRTSKKKLKSDYPIIPVHLRPELSFYQGFVLSNKTTEDNTTGTVFSPYITVLRLEPKDSSYCYLDIISTLNLMQRWRHATMSQSNDLSESVRSLLSGHQTDGTPLKAPHVAFIPHASVGHKHADGHLLGVGLALPENISREDRQGLMVALGRVHEIRLGPLGVWNITPVIESQPPVNLRSNTWTAYPEGATRWGSVTPIVFDVHPKTKEKSAYLEKVATMISQACVRIGLPPPIDVIVSGVSSHSGAPSSREFPSVKRKDGSKRQQTHAILIFDKPVIGPIILGAGRYRGYGLCKPINSFNQKGFSR